ncbi:MAG: hypothetical protein K8R90_11360 [Candidatus Cloacimonetes bacterium]|nr:hypothetical protein [Candidatus Cloacimonadota bacterium]
MKTMRIALFLVAVAALVMACGGEDKPGVNRAYYPDWWMVQGNPDQVYSFGMDTKVSQTSSYDAAYANAILMASQYVETKVAGMVKNYEEEAGRENPQVLALTSKVIKSVTDASFQGAMVNKQETIILDNGRYQTFVRIAVPKETVNRNLMNQIQNEEALYNAFKATQAFDELQTELDRN